MSAPGTLALATRGLRKSYGKRLALDGLDLSVPGGVVYGFLGPNGAGKTTTMRLLTGLLHPDAGSIELLGRSFRRGDRKRLFEVGALVESPSFYPYLSGRRNLQVLAATGAGVPPRRIEELLELVGLRERAKDKVSGYSLGMKQRLGIAGALLSDPKLLLLDEPANGLDPAGIVAMRETLRRLAGMGKTVFVSSHLLAEVRVLADVVGIIAAGRLVREGTLDSLLPINREFVGWLKKHPKGKFFSIFTDHLSAQNVYLFTHMQKLNEHSTLQIDKDATDDQLAKSRTLFLHTETLKHDDTVQWLERWLRTRKLN